ncbi:GspH/FimT family protein [Shewanella inventionis]|uniref:Type II secretion system protein H n=1 Tax=Shewanella inventionis TaxID=1738770 RepID=A0ABQ1J6X4_9GAMM|nr:GspH/FimT family protein [Shewanella inventionis]MCL1157920.1 GspH/FimT family protein [Shewanella inventionis]UAL42682.1 GspH/FimT family protein [Shewanella inventionis]GGB60180.1 type IV minor pilin protein FimT [Shewanella inventionis]
MTAIYLTKGFSLIEVIVTSLLIMLLSLIAIPSFSAVNEQIRAQSSIKVIQQTIQFGRNMAITYGTRVTVCPIVDNKCSADWSIGLSVFIDQGKKNQLDANDQILQQTSAFNENDYVSYNRAAVRFQPDGLASGTNGTLTYCPGTVDSEYSKAVIVNQAGRARMSKKKNIICKSN